MTADSSKVDEAGTLAFLDNAVDSLTGSVTAKARFDNQQHALWPGEYVRVNVELDVQPSGDGVAAPCAVLSTLTEETQRNGSTSRPMSRCINALRPA